MNTRSSMLYFIFVFSNYANKNINISEDSQEMPQSRNIAFPLLNVFLWYLIFSTVYSVEHYPSGRYNNFSVLRTYTQEYLQSRNTVFVAIGRPVETTLPRKHYI